MPGSDSLPVQDSVIAPNDFQNSSILSEENLKFLDSPSTPSAGDHPQTKDSPLTDIGTSPPPFEIPSLGDRRAHSRDSYESSELSDLGDDESEAETDKMDFLNEDANSGLGDRDSDLQRLSDLTDLANLQELDSDDSDDDVSRHVSSPSPAPSSDHVDPDQDVAVEAGEEVAEEPAEEAGEEPTTKAFEEAKEEPVEEDNEETGEKASEEDGEESSEGAAESTQAIKRPLETTIDAVSEKAKENSPDQADPESTKRRKIAEESTPDGSMSTTDPELDVDIEPELNVVQDIIQNGSEPVSWPDKSAITAIAAVDSSAGTKDESSTSDDVDEQPLTDAKLPRSEADVDEGATADVEDAVKQEQNEDDDENEEDGEIDEDGEHDEIEEDGEIEGIEEDGEHEEIEELADKPVSESEQESELPEPEEFLDLDEQRKSAVEELISIENDFSFLRDKLYRDKLSLLEHEMQLCLDGSHPELLQIYYKVNEFYQDNIKLANSTLNYSLKCINTETLATRTSIHQNFMKNLSGMRNDMITETTSSWYKINKEWNYLDSAVADYNFTAIPSSNPNDSCMPFVAGGSSAEYYQDNSVVNKKIQKQNTIVELVRRRNCINAQLGILDGLKEFHGIPSAVSNSLLDDEDAFQVEELLLRKASPDEIKEDLQAMGIY